MPSVSASGVWTSAGALVRTIYKASELIDNINYNNRTRIKNDIIDLCAECHLNCQLNFIHSCEWLFFSAVFSPLELKHSIGRWAANACAKTIPVPEKKTENKTEWFCVANEFYLCFRPQAIWNRTSVTWPKIGHVLHAGRAHSLYI